MHFTSLLAAFLLVGCSVAFPSPPGTLVNELLLFEKKTDTIPLFRKQAGE
jgi:hypothetical protein